MKKIKKILVILVLCVVPYSSIYSLTIKIGSIAPKGSPWDIALRKIARDWKSISNGKVKLKIYPGGIVGDESNMIRKMRIGQLHGAILTNFGMSNISPEVLSISMPFLINNEKELDYVLQKRTPYFETLMSKKGFKVVSWSKAGWVYFFSKYPVKYPDDLKKQPLAVASNDAAMLQAWRKVGFNAVPLSANDVMTGLQSGMVQAYYSTPLVSGALQWFALAPNMCNVKIAPMVGGFIFSKRIWRRIPDKYKQDFTDSSNRVVLQLNRDSKNLEKEAMKKMKKHGLKVHNVSRRIYNLWKREAAKGHNVYIGKTFSKKLFNDIKNDLRSLR